MFPLSGSSKTDKNYVQRIFTKLYNKVQNQMYIQAYERFVVRED